MSTYERAAHPFRALLNHDQLQDLRGADAMGRAISLRLADGRWLDLVRGGAQEVSATVHEPAVLPATAPAREPVLDRPAPWSLTPPARASRRSR